MDKGVSEIEDTSAVRLSKTFDHPADSLGAENLCAADPFTDVAHGLVVRVLFRPGLDMEGVDRYYHSQGRHSRQSIAITVLTGSLLGLHRTNCSLVSLVKESIGFRSGQQIK